MPDAQYDYRFEDDRFILFDSTGNVILETVAPHTAADKALISHLCDLANAGRIIFPKT